MREIKMKGIVLAVFLLLSSTAFATQSMRRCMLLPISDQVGGSVGFKVFEEVERYLKDSSWCYYESNSEILNILSNYKNSLHESLENPEVLKIISEKSRAGTLVKIDLKFYPKGSDVLVKIIGENGKDVYFMEKTSLDSNDPVIMGQTVKNWLEVYEKNIPYDGLVTGVLGNQFTVDIGKMYGLGVDRDIEIRRIKRKRRHPLLKEIVDWETVKVGEARIFHAADTQAQGKVIKYDDNRRTQIGDWVLIKELANDDVKAKYNEVKEDDNNFGKLGKAGVFFTLGSGSVAVTGGSSTKKMSGLLLGIDLETELWLTRKYWVGFDLTRKFGSYSKSTGSLQSDSNSMSFGSYKLKAGYKYLPLGFFYGPQIDGYIGYASNNYGLDTQANDGITEVTFSGLLLGGRGSVPIANEYRIYLGLEFILGPSYEEEVAVNGGDDSASNFELEIGGSYQYSPSMQFEAGLNHLNSKAKFKNPDKTMNLKDTSLRVGATFNF